MSNPSDINHLLNTYRSWASDKKKQRKMETDLYSGSDSHCELHNA